MKNIGIIFDKFNKACKPFVITRYGKRVSVVYYKDATDYIFDLLKKLPKKRICRPDASEDYVAGYEQCEKELKESVERTMWELSQRSKKKIKEENVRTLFLLIFWTLLSIVAYGFGGGYYAVLVWTLAFGLGSLKK